MPTLTTLASATLAVGLLATAPLALARDDDVRVAGDCTGASSVKLKLSEENGRVEVELEVDENRVGSRWRVVLTRGGTRVASRSARTGGRSGSFETRAVVTPRGATTRVAAVARQARSGEVCRVRAAIRL